MAQEPEMKTENDSNTQEESENMSTEPQVAVSTSNVMTEPTDIPHFGPGDTVRVHYRIVEGDKARIQPFEGIVIGMKGEGMSKTFMVRKIGADSVGVERIFPLYSPNIEKLEVVKKGKVRRAKLYYMRDKKGRAASRVRQAIKKTSKNDEMDVVDETEIETTEE